jgi:hypothetical protein
VRVRCRGTADYRSNAVGSLELESRSEGLSISLRGVSRYREGYAPGPPVHANAVVVPWASVYATCIGDQSLLLSVDARFLPQNRLLLVHFADPPPEAPPGLSPQRRRLIAGSASAGLLSLGVALGMAGMLPHPRALGTFGLAALLAALTMALLALLARRAPRRSSEEVLGEFSVELARHLSNHLAVEAPAPPPRRSIPVDLSGLLPRSALGIAITLAAATLAALVGSSAARPSASVRVEEHGGALRVGAPPVSTPSETPPFERSVTASSPAPVTPSDPARLESIDPLGREPPWLAEPQFGDACECRRDAEQLASEPLPRLATLILRRDVRQHEGHRHTALELAVVNDGASEAARIGLTVLFYEERGGANAGQWQTSERPLHFEGPLGAGRLIKWHVEGRGSSFDIIGADFGTLAPDGSDTAPAAAFVALARDGSRALRWHAARLLAFLGDDRARDLAIELRPSASASAVRYLDRLAMAPHDVVACRLEVTRGTSQRWRLDACLFNRAREPRRDLRLRLLALDGGLSAARANSELPEVLAEHTARLDLELPAESGRAVALSALLPVESGAVPRAFDVVLDREENLP